DASLGDIKAYIEANRKPYYVAEARTYIELYPKEELPNAEKVYKPIDIHAMEHGIVALYKKCVPLGCRVPFCESSQWFECPCHGSKYNLAGEVQPGSPAPAGLWRFMLTIEDNVITGDTSLSQAQPAKGTDTIKEPPAGSHCV